MLHGLRTAVGAGRSRRLARRLAGAHGAVRRHRARRRGHVTSQHVPGIDDVVAAAAATTAAATTAHGAVTATRPVTAAAAASAAPAAPTAFLAALAAALAM